MERVEKKDALDQGSNNFSLDVDLIYSGIQSTGKGFYIASTILLGIIGFGIYAYLCQLSEGLGVTGMNRPVYWGIYMANFVFFTGISMAGTLLSAILRISNAEWRRPITRCAEVITLLALIFGGLSIIIDMGRPYRILNVLKFGRLQSPILWDAFCFTTYMTASLLYLYFPLIPDLAHMRDRKVGWRWLYRILALGFNGSEKQEKRLQCCISIMAVLIIPIAISVHTVVSYVFATTLQPGWHSTIMGPYFVVGAIFSGLAALLITMAILRKAFRMEGIIKNIHFNNLGLVLLAMTCTMIYFTFNIYLVEITGNEPTVMSPVSEKMFGEYAILFWGMITVGFILPAIILAFPKGRTVTGCVVASILIVVAMWVERFLIVVPTLMHPRLPWYVGVYHPTWYEWAITAGCLAAFAFLYMLFTKFFPIVSIWEVEEGIENAIPEIQERFRTYMPERISQTGHD